MMARLVFSIIGCVSATCLAADTSAENSSGQTVIVVTEQAGTVQVLQRGYGRSNGSGTQVRTDADPKDNVERFVLLAPRGPVVVEVTLTLDGQPFRMVREKLVDEMLAAADTDGDGKPTWQEALANPRFSFGNSRYRYLVIQQQGRNQRQLKAQRDALIKQYDRNQDGAVDRAEARLMLAQTTGGAVFGLTPAVNRGSRPEILKVLDADGDREISKAELKSAEERLKSRDANDNDLLEAAEVGGSPTYGGNRIRIVQGGRYVPPTAGTAVGHLLGPVADWKGIVKALNDTYGGDDKQITAGSWPLLPKLFKQLDANGNDRLDADEVKGLNDIKPHLVMEISLGKADAFGLRITSLAAELGNAKAIEEKFEADAMLELPGLTLQLTAPKVTTVTVNYTQTAQRMLTVYDKNKNGYIEKDELQGNNVYLKQQFDRWDMNSDGKVYADEIKADYDRQQAPQRSRIQAAVDAQGPSLFTTLDVSGDNRLSVREMRTAGQRLLSLDKNGDGSIDPAELPTRIVVAFQQGNSYGRVLAFTPNGRLVQGQQPTGRTPKGPKWFVSMDRNGDGDLTPKEFLGTPDQFKEVDTNQDGFIEPKEADAFDAAMKKTGK